MVTLYITPEYICIKYNLNYIIFIITLLSLILDVCYIKISYFVHLRKTGNVVCLNAYFVRHLEKDFQSRGL